MSEIFWQAKIWGLLHDPVLKALHDNSGRSGNSFWRKLRVMQDWVDQDIDPETSQSRALQHIHLADYVASASDRGAVGTISSAVNYGREGLDITHLLSGETLRFRLRPEPHERLTTGQRRAEFLRNLEEVLLPDSIRQEDDIKFVFWWLWRCLPDQVCQQFSQDETLLLMPAETRLPDSSIWNHASITAALSGALAGFDLPLEELNRWSGKNQLSHPYLAAFSFTPVQELIKASRKMRDFWAGSWILHYLSAKVSWELALRYGPDSFIYPSLFQQPLIDHWLLEQFPTFEEWILAPTERQLLTAGFPNVLVLILPKGKVKAAMQFAEETLRREWLALGRLVFSELADTRGWMQRLRQLPDLAAEHKTWNGWLGQQWQVYWSSVAIGKDGEAFKSAAIPEERNTEFQTWLTTQNQAFEVRGDNALFQTEELAFLRQAYNLRLETQGRRSSVNVGSWWPFIFSKARAALAGVKNARTWELPTVFSVRSTVSGLGPAVHPGQDWLPEGDIKKLWKRQAGLFDGKEQLNATETVKRGLHKVLNQLLDISDATFAASYPDLTAGVAGYLKVNRLHREHQEHFQNACRAIRRELWVEDFNAAELTEQAWGIPWIDEHQPDWVQRCHSRFLNAGWLAEEVENSQTQALENQIRHQQDAELRAELNQELLQLRVTYRQQIQEILDSYYPQNNPTDWYVLAVGDGDEMNQWLRGTNLEPYGAYIPSGLSLPTNNEQQQNLNQAFEQFLRLRKRMGPSTHSALSRALLDFSNQLLPYLTEQRYAGRLIYGGGDDVLAYTNLWEWDAWLWDVHECFRGDPDPQEKFDHTGDYWKWNSDELPPNLSARPLFTMGAKATISFGVVIAHHSVPLAISLENLWDAEKQAKAHQAPDGQAKDAVQIRVLYGNGNTLPATSKFATFDKWRKILNAIPDLETAPALFEQAAQLWEQHPAPTQAAIAPWTIAFCNRRDFFNNDDDQRRVFSQTLASFLTVLWQSTTETSNSGSGGAGRDQEIQNWLKLAAFVLRKRIIDLSTVPSRGGQL
ncbi:type III-B CRISPR-associated protein Cas10/Cmr2 [Synechococcus sp. PCC 6312]|uniref:type III-B CRISPR-associated protein Cas10/Cmr2 n=1 Tax=Synechococcus sp. (strain ATCC 27167 / PCC 6312) TaxID=195253 RepID=UPI00029F0439|nr:type III-B CRISPR-associated protein Cas10/Cmr2 [Synechococcus sp. PCC 6312]AFY61935.1 CRISPR-associated protein Cas10/Cmr2, subtype III-B [Synechococcus sp. PCC 6312]